MNRTDCPDCGTGIEMPHKTYCDIERCSICGGQQVACRCEGHNQIQAAWNGEWPTWVETFDQGKARWDRMLGMNSTVDECGHLIYRSPTGFPLAMAGLERERNGCFRAFFGHTIGLQNDWLVAKQAKRPNRKGRHRCSVKPI